MGIDSDIIESDYEKGRFLVKAFVSVKDCEAADLNSINAVQMIFENLPKAYLTPTGPINA